MSLHKLTLGIYAIFAFLLVVCIWFSIMLFKLSNQAAVIGINCNQFRTKVSAKQFVNVNPAAARLLDRDNDGIPCESLP